MGKKEKIIEIWKKNKLVFVAIFTMVVLFFPIGLIHELGHILICMGNGFEYTFFMGDLAMNVQCSNTPQPLLLYFALGGIFGLISSLMLFLLPIVRKNKGIFIGVSITGFDHFLKAIFETFTHSAYLNNANLSLYMSVISIFFMFSLVLFFSKRSNKMT